MLICCLKVATVCLDMHGPRRQQAGEVTAVKGDKFRIRCLYSVHSGRCTAKVLNTNEEQSVRLEPYCAIGERSSLLLFSLAECLEDRSQQFLS